MPTLLNPSHSAAFDAVSNRIVLTFRDGREAALVEMDADAAPGLISALMAARSLAKQARRPAEAAPPPERPERPAPGRTTFSLALPADLVPVRQAAPLSGRRAALVGAGVIGVHGPRGGRVRRS